MNVEFSVRRQRVYFTAAVEMYRIAADVLDTVHDVELPSESTHRYVLNTATRTYEKGKILEEMGHEQCVATPRQETRLYRAREKYRDASNLYLARREEARRAGRMDPVDA
jgi:hypothetical protein